MCNNKFVSISPYVYVRRYKKCIRVSVCVLVPHHAEYSRKARPLADDAERKRRKTQTSRAVIRLVQNN